MTREKPARLVDQRKCEWILSKPNALSGALAGLRGDDLTAGEGARRRSSSSKACRPRSPGSFVIRFEVVIAAGSWSAWKRCLASRPRF
jgi:hypothetical protein